MYELLVSDHPKYSTDNSITGIQVMDSKKRSFESRITTTNHPLAHELYKIMSTKKTNLCVAADVTTSEELISLAKKVSYL